MRALKFIIILLSLTGTFYNLNAQLAMGKWRTHLAYNQVTQIAQSENKIFAVSEGALFSIDKEDLGMEFYSKLSGLSDVNISRIEYDKINKQLLITYNNGNIDLMTEGGIINIPDLYMKQMSASKSVNQIRFLGDRAYLACDFGIMVVNMTKREIADTYFIGPNGTELRIIATTTFQDDIYAISKDKLYKATLNSPNISNYQYWETVNNLPGSGDLKALVSFAGKIVIQRDNKLYYYNNNVWTALFHDLSIGTLNISDNKMFIVDLENNQLYIADEQFNKKMVDGIGFVYDTEYDEERDITWLAAGNFGLLTFDENATNRITEYQPKGPLVNKAWDMQFNGNKLVVVPGGRWAAFYETPGDIMMFDNNDNNEWTNIKHTDIEAITGIRCRDFITVAIDPFDKNRFFAASYSSGLYEFRKNQFFKHHTSSNSTLESISNKQLYYMTGGTNFDNDGNLWVMNSYANKSVKVLLKDDGWRELDFPIFKNIPTIEDILISKKKQSQKWVISARTSVAGVFVFDDNGTITDQSDDRSVFFKQFDNSDEPGSKITPTYYYDIAEDKDGVIWVGTNEGPLLFYNTSRVFDEGYTCTRVKIPRNDGTELADYLLKDEKIKAIAIDGANRKWLGTESSGVFLMSENGQNTIQHLNTTNSPLLSDDILSIEINPLTGEVFFGTSKGIISYQSNAVDADNTFNNVHAYPNPVRENYNGVITITGLVADSQIKITDINGNLVTETVSNGGIATWDGKDYRKRKVNTGIYLVIAVAPDGSQSATTKIMIIN
ncbi:MAG: two-component regulator propeller domain-containing protein [Paludibacter sp.]|jgi:hypothetical protein|nr:two-component regulator propeller domain-containing protein [Paludibacter sp.]